MAAQRWGVIGVDLGESEGVDASGGGGGSVGGNVGAGGLGRESPRRGGGDKHAGQIRFPDALPADPAVGGNGIPLPPQPNDNANNNNNNNVNTNLRGSGGDTDSSSSGAEGTNNLGSDGELHRVFSQPRSVVSESEGSRGGGSGGVEWPVSEISSDTLGVLTDFYGPLNAAVASLLARELPWTGVATE